MEQPWAQWGVGHACRFGMAAPAPVRAGDGSARTDARGHLVRKPTRWTSSSPEILKRACLRCSNE
eukprot:15437413-Alexandrium_andersonii.AAC.1